MPLVKVIWAVALVATTALGADQLRPGMVLDEATWPLATELLSPEILEHYKSGEYANPIAEWKDGDVRWSADFLSATQANAGRFDVDADGAIIERNTGQRPAFIYGFPFPRIEATDPNGGVKVLWNYYYGYWANGSRRNVTSVVWLGRTSVQRSAMEEVFFCQYDGQPEEFRPKGNADDLLQQFLATTVQPADLQGTWALTWRYRSAAKRDSNWAYVPALRRIRQVSSANRSDGFLGSDMSQDDGPFFDGKPEDFTWKLVGDRRMLRLADPYSLHGDYKYVALPGGGWRVPFKPVPMVGFQESNWHGVAWAPVNFVLVERPAWVIEGVPRDPYYLYGKIQLYIDKENYRGAWSRKFDWKGQLVATYQIGAYVNGTPDGTHYFWGHGLYYQVAENLRQGRATFAGAPPTGTHDPANDFFVPYKPDFFSYQSLVRFGK
ncbi:MAG: outer membrane lipoprotein-sorting protein [Candidatus Binatia bacterium]